MGLNHTSWSTTGATGRPPLSPRNVVHVHGVGVTVTFEAAVQILRELRQSRGLTVPQVSQKSGVGKSAIQNYEAGLRTPPLDVLHAWAAALGRRVVFELEEPEAADGAASAADLVRSMDETRARLALRFVQLAATAEPGQLRAALAALEAIMTASGAALPAEQEPRRERA